VNYHRAASTTWTAPTANHDVTSIRNLWILKLSKALANDRNLVDFERDDSLHR
jgi:hypothetical protein